jgi:hypothetical protein
LYQEETWSRIWNPSIKYFWKFIPMIHCDHHQLHFHHVGGRGGTILPILKVLGDDQVLWLYEADADCIPQIVEQARSTPWQTHVTSAFIGRRSEAVCFRLNYDPCTSSSLPPNPALADAGYLSGTRDDPFPPTGDYIYRDTCQVVRKIPLSTVSLEEVTLDRNIPVDYLSLDTQGTELDILREAPTLLATQCLVLSTELCFEQIYDRQALATDVIAHCRAHGFRLMHIQPHAGASWHRAPLGWRGRGALFSGDALFFKDPATVRSRHSNVERDLRKLAMFSLLHGFFANMVECLEQLAFCEPDRLERRYERLIARLQCCLKADPHLQPPSFTEVFSAADSAARFNAGARHDAAPDWKRTRERYFSKTPLDRFKACFPSLCSPEPTAAEQELLAVGLARSAAALREHRLEHAMIVARLLGLTTMTDGQESIDLEAISRLTVPK